MSRKTEKAFTIKVSPGSYRESPFPDQPVKREPGNKENNANETA